jgi:formate hydrogenlyase subunit 3/multisubunit Na+/H+ antiporter MnhD subunit
MSSITSDIKLLKISFSYFCLSVAASLLIIFCFFVIYLIFGEVNFDKIILLLNLVDHHQYWFIKSIFWLLALAFLLKFFPLWIFFEKLKSSSLVAGFMVIDSLFVKTLVGIFLMIKFCYFLFGAGLIFSSFHFDVALLIIAVLLIFYSAFKLYNQKHLKLICAYLCLNNLGFIIAAIALQSLESLQSMMFYLLSFCLVNLLIFLFAIFLKRHFKTSSIDKIFLIRNSSLALPLKFLIFFISAFPLTLLFFANWHLALASMQLNFRAIILVGLVVSNFTHCLIGFKFIRGLFFSEDVAVEKGPILQNSSFYLISFWLLIIVILISILFVGILNDFAISLASYLLSNTI